MQSKIPVDGHSTPERLNDGFRAMYWDETYTPGHPERGVRGRDSDVCPVREEFINEVLERLKRGKIKRETAVLPEDEDLAG